MPITFPRLSPLPRSDRTDERTDARGSSPAVSSREPDHTVAVQPTTANPGDRQRFSAVFRRIVRHPLLLLLLVALALTAAGHFLEREWAHWLGQRAPSSWVKAASARTLQRLDATTLGPSTLPHDRQAAINTRFASLVVPDSSRPLYELVFRSGGKLGARSFTLAGGQIVITDEWVKQFHDERALLSELAVQLGHLQHDDALRGAVDKAPMRMLLALVEGDADKATSLMSDAQPVLQHDAHCEEEAREYGRAVMQANP